jgi:hypothetical protein
VIPWRKSRRSGHSFGFQDRWSHDSFEELEPVSALVTEMIAVLWRSLNSIRKRVDPTQSKTKVLKSDGVMMDLRPRREAEGCAEGSEVKEVVK